MVFWDVTQYSLLDRYELFSRMYCFQGCVLLWNVYTCLLDYTALHPRWLLFLQLLLSSLLWSLSLSLSSLLLLSSNLKLECLLFHLYNIYRILCSVLTVSGLALHIYIYIRHTTSFCGIMSVLNKCIVHDVENLSLLSLACDYI